MQIQQQARFQALETKALPPDREQLALLIEASCFHWRGAEAGA